MKTLVQQGEPMWKKTHKIRRIIGNWWSCWIKYF